MSTVRLFKSTAVLANNRLGAPGLEKVVLGRSCRAHPSLSIEIGHYIKGKLTEIQRRLVTTVYNVSLPVLLWKRRWGGERNKNPHLSQESNNLIGLYRKLKVVLSYQ